MENSGKLEMEVRLERLTRLAQRHREHPFCEWEEESAKRRGGAVPALAWGGGIPITRALSLLHADRQDHGLVEVSMGRRRRGPGRRKVGRKKRRMRAKIRHRK